MVGILRCGKMLPPQLNLVIKIEFADATTALWSENAGAHPAGATLSTDFENVQVLASQVVLDSALVESFNRVLLSRKVPRVQLPHGAHAAVQRPERRGEVTSTHGRRSMNGRVFSSPVAGFSTTHMRGAKCAMISRALSTSASPSSIRRGRVVSARLYSVQTGLAQTMSKCPDGNVV